MIRWLALTDFAIVERAELEFAGGLTVVTGETGAGKSLIVDALALLLGQRADALVIRHGAVTCEIQADFAIDHDPAIAQWLAANELDAQGECLVRRVIARERGSRGYINGRAVPAQTLRELGGQLVEIHGQHEFQSLLRRDVQRQYLDEYADIADETARLAVLSRTITQQAARHEQLASQLDERQARGEWLEFQTTELTSLALEPHEIPTLESAQRRLAHASELAAGVAQVLDTLRDAQGAVVDALDGAGVALARLAEFDPRLAELGAQLEHARIDVDDAATSLRDRLDAYEIDPAEQQRVEQRLTRIHDLARKHRVAPEMLAARLATLAGEFATLGDADAGLVRLAAEIAGLQHEYDGLAATVGKARRSASRRLARTLAKELAALGMTGTRFEARLQPLDAAARGPSGTEQIEFLVSANPNQPPQPLARVASGGELSRISLALQVIAAGSDDHRALVFDEVDVGIGGRVAEIVGTRLKSLGERRQVLCITHLPQVAAQGQHHVQVEKRAAKAGGVTLRRLDERQRVNEIARMLGGIAVTDHSIAHAAEMLDRANP